MLKTFSFPPVSLELSSSLLHDVNAVRARSENDSAVVISVILFIVLSLGFNSLLSGSVMLCCFYFQVLVLRILAVVAVRELWVTS